VGLVLARKAGKLPSKSYQVEYDLEYGSNKLELHLDAITPGEKVVIIDDLLATGGTALATTELVGKCGGEVCEIAFLVELAFLSGRERLAKFPVFSVISY
jgi:adenine phosphoribosyltransferase